MNSTAPVALEIPQLEVPLRMYVHGEEDRYISRHIKVEGIWEIDETELLLSLLQPGDVFVDVGANIGYFSLLAAAAVGEDGQVLAFEPDPANMRLLCASAKLNNLQQRIEAVEAGLTEHDASGCLYLSEDNFGDHQTYAGMEQRNSLPITLYNGSDYLRSRIRRLDLLKVDTQGAEFGVMAGLMPLLRELPRCPTIIIELTPFSLRQGGASGRQLIELLATLDQPFWIIDNLEHQLAPTTAADLATWCDNVDKWEGDQGFMNIVVGPTGKA
jgi:FkbM family methyltransferase